LFFDPEDGGDMFLGVVSQKINFSDREWSSIFRVGRGANNFSS
jgi:hypothetical protein